MSHNTGVHKGAPKEGLPGTAPPKLKFKETDFVDILLSKILRDFPFSGKQPLKSADDKYIRILKNKLIKFKKRQEDRTL
jgi:hypothetical protein